MKAPNLTIIPGWQCLTGIGERYVESKTTSGKFYLVFISSNERDPHTCNCPHFVHRGLATHFKTCKHIDMTLVVDVCGWNSLIHGEEPNECVPCKSEPLENCLMCNGSRKVCPQCFGSVEAMSVDV